MCRTCACPAWCSAGWCGRRATARPRVASTTAKARAIPGVIAVVRDGTFLGVVAAARGAGDEGARGARRRRDGSSGRTARSGARFAHLKSLPTKVEVIGVKQAPLPQRAEDARGDLHQALHGARLDRAVVRGRGVQGRQLTVWTHTQGVFPLRGDLAKALGCRPRTCADPCGGAGCYGHNGADDVALDALCWRAPCRAAGAAAVDARRRVRLGALRFRRWRCRRKAALDGEGRIVDWKYELWSNSHTTRPLSTSGVNVLAAWYLAEPQQDGAADQRRRSRRRRRPQRHAALRFPEPEDRDHFIKEMPLRVSALRTLGAYANVFAIESFMDELAVAAGADPVEFRLRI